MNWYKLKTSEKQLILQEINLLNQMKHFAIEKDWWVVQTLRLISQMEVADQLVFKGGTSLSKAWGLIDRFSEDIDLAINREFFGFSGKISRTQIKKMRDKSCQYLSNQFLNELREKFHNAGMFDVSLAVIDQKSPDEDPVKIAVRYPTVTNYLSYVKPQVLLEIGSRSLIEPYTEREFRSVIGDTYPELPFADENIKVRCVNPERTFLEKLFLLHEEHQRPIEKMNIKRKSRHFYDIYRIAQTDFAQKAVADKELYKSIVEHREKFSKLGGVDYKLHFPPNLNPIPPVNLLPEWEKDYTEMQQMIVNDTPTFKDLMAKVQEVTDKINHLK
jgi:predicted nucleotidyltransferase component of viral defense system